MDKTLDRKIVGSRIKYYRELKGMSQTELARRVGYTGSQSRSTISYIEKGRSDVNSEKLKLFARVLGVSPTDLLGLDVQDDEPKNVLHIEEKQHNTIPLIGQIACGTPILAEQNIEDMLPCLPGVSADLALRCQGDSMKDAGIYDGDIAYVKLQPVVENGSLVAVQIGDEATLKRFAFDGNKMVLQPANQDYRPLVFQGAQLANVKVLGKVVGVIRRFK